MYGFLPLQLLPGELLGHHELVGFCDRIGSLLPFFLIDRSCYVLKVGVVTVGSAGVFTERDLLPKPYVFRHNPLLMRNSQFVSMHETGSSKDVSDDPDDTKT